MLVFFTQALFGGILRGCSKQPHVAVINVFSYYMIGLPISLALVYAADMGAFGFWIGCTVGCYTQVSMLPFIISILELILTNKTLFYKLRTLTCAKFLRVSSDI